MIIKEIPYIKISPEVGFSISASLWMILRHAGLRISPEEINEIFCHSYLSEEFREYLKDYPIDNVSETTTCAMFTINERLEGYKAILFNTDLPAIRYSFLKRHMPVIITGYFPSINDTIINSIVLKGYVDDFFIVNDPRGDAVSLYRDSNGENHLYRLDDITGWFGSDIVNILRVEKL